ncbi:MAG: hypothetical protein IPK00_24160 [Deltaproteobacteria bacterium]|nr:hypothetical protein [Deltaproteobacteria bacterium]
MLISAMSVACAEYEENELLAITESGPVAVDSKCDQVAVPRLSLRVDHKRCRDSGRDIHYEYEDFLLSLNEESIFARSYLDEPKTVDMRAIIGGETYRMLGRPDFKSNLFCQSVSFLKSLGKSTFKYLTNDGYQDVPAQFVRECQPPHNQPMQTDEP